jgi:hypothetical protein
MRPRTSIDSASTVVRDPRAAEDHHAHHHPARETTPLLGEDAEEVAVKSPSAHDHDHGHEHDAHEPLLPHDDSHSHKHGHGHSHGSMNMRALVLHVIGDALGNVGVILTGLIIWKSTWIYKYYCDPVISLIITVIIFSSALPLGTYPSSPAFSLILTLHRLHSEKRFLHPSSGSPTHSLTRRSQRCDSRRRRCSLFARVACMAALGEQASRFRTRSCITEPRFHADCCQDQESAASFGDSF